MSIALHVSTGEVSAAHLPCQPAPPWHRENGKGGTTLMAERWYSAGDRRQATGLSIYCMLQGRIVPVKPQPLITGKSSDS